MGNVDRTTTLNGFLLWRIVSSIASGSTTTESALMKERRLIENFISCSQGYNVPIAEYFFRFSNDIKEPRKGKKTCNYCHREGHAIEDCRVRTFNNSQRGRGQSDGRGRGESRGRDRGRGRSNHLGEPSRVLLGGRSRGGILPRPQGRCLLGQQPQRFYRRHRLGGTTLGILYPGHLRNLRTSERITWIEGVNSEGAPIRCTQEGEFLDFGPICFAAQASPNLLSLRDVHPHCSDIIYDFEYPPPSSSLRTDSTPSPASYPTTRCVVHLDPVMNSLE
jgi:hypothetical protein